MNKATIVIASVLLALAPLAAAANIVDDPAVRIFVHSESELLREQLGVRHDFGSYFSTNVPTSVYLNLLATGETVSLVQVREIAVYKDEDWVAAQEKTDAKPGGGTTTRAVPTDQTPYGIEQIYNSATITSTSGGAGVRLGHFDTGILSTHLDLTNRIVACESTASNSCADKNGHGTHTAGTAAADAGSDKKGIFGVASEASIHTIKVCSDGGLCFQDDTLAAIDRCIAAGCNVITYSIGGSTPSETERAKIIEFNNANGLFIAANGNSGPDPCTIGYPGGFKEVVGVAAIDSTKTVASFSSRGCSADSNSYDEDGETDLAAGGVSTESTWSDGTYKKISGTSMATPHVSGLALKKWTGSRSTTLNALMNGVEDITKGDHAATGVDIASGNGLPHV